MRTAGDGKAVLALVIRIIKLLILLAILCAGVFLGLEFRDAWNASEGAQSAEPTPIVMST